MSKLDPIKETIKQLAGLLKDEGLTEIEIENDAFGKIRVRKESQIISAPAYSAPSISTGSEAVAKPVASNLHEIKSPMVGTFYASPSPDAAAFIKAGDRINKGQVLCILEAMKLMNEFPADTEGEVVEICVKNGEAVSFGQVLFRVKK